MTPAHPLPLFDPRTTMPEKCGSCDATKKNLCRWAADREHFGIDAKQPRHCLLRWDPSIAPFPKGY